MNDAAYVLVTPARNEAATLERTIEAVVAQRIRPARWVIVSDASTDETDAIAKRYAAQHDFIMFIRKEGEKARDFGAKVHAIRKGYEHLSGVPYGYIGNLDADVTFAPDYFEQLLARFAGNPKLGIAGGVTYDVIEGRPHPRRASLDSVGGAVQLFRRACYEEVGGYLPLRGGLEDATAIYMARWKGWESKSFPELPVMHHRPTGTAGQSVWRAKFIQGKAQYIIGWSPWWILVRAGYRVFERPYVLGSLVRTLGFFWALLKREPHSLPPELIRFIRREQHEKLWQGTVGRLRRG
jgi:glycosyltransferase involved in cell wall biosynthesis